MDIKNRIKSWIWELSDKDTSPYRGIGLKEQVKRTLRYKLAGSGLPVTANEKYIYSLKNKHKGKRCFIIGNGPSLNKCDLTLLKNEICFGFNSIFLNYDKMGFYPDYYVVEDCLVAEDRAKEINQLTGVTKFFGNHLDYCLENTPGTYWFNVIMDYTDYTNFPNFSKNIARRVCVGGTVTYQALQMAYYMGFSEVYMIGYDHSYVIPASAEHNTSTARIMSKEDDPNHFHPDYFGKGFRWHDPNVARMEVAYIKAKNYFEADNRKIFNATVGGKLEVFVRVNYESLFT